MTRSLGVGFRFEIRGRAAAEELLGKGRFTHLVSIRDVGSEPLAGAAFVRDRIELEFDDASDPASSVFGYQPVQLEDLRLLVDWVRGRERELRQGHCLFQCEQGISRSSAAACIVFRALGSTRQAALERVKAEHPRAMPNPLMLTLSEQLFGNGH